MRETKNIIFKRLGLGLIQHMLAALILLFLAMVLFHSFMTVYTMNGQKTYSLDPMSQETSFDESDVFQDLFQTAVSDVIQLVIIRDQLETKGEFDPSKKIDVTAFMNRYGVAGMDYGTVTACYELEDLIKWVRYGGLDYKNRVMSLSDFVNYYGQACIPENFDIDSNGNLYFKGYVAEKERITLSEERSLEIQRKMESFSKDQLEDMAFAYIMGKVGDGITMAREDDGNLTVYINTLNCRYSTIDQKGQLFDLAENWWDFMQLQKNVADTCTTLAQNYELYQSCAGLYKEGHSNLKYVVRLRNATGEKETFTNISAYASYEDEKLTEVFEDSRRYLIYYPNSLEIMGNAEFTEGYIYENLKKAHYPYLDEVYLWIGLDINFENKEDAFYYANSVFERIVPYMAAILTGFILMTLAWVVILLYLTVTVGVSGKDRNDKGDALIFFDRLWTEVYVLLVVGVSYGIYRGVLYLKTIAENVYESRMTLGNQYAGGLLYQYGMYALFGFAASMMICLLWYSFVRRIRALNFYRDSLLRHLLHGIGSLFDMVMGHQSSVISVLLPYIIFVLLQISAVVGFLYLEKMLWRVLVLAAILLLDIVVGVRLFLRNAEYNDIIEGINRIRLGEVEYKLNTESLHGVNKYLADAVNNIGEGIDNAVKTSVKDERLKTDLITNVSHDLKTPLTSIINYVDLLKRSGITQQPAKSYIDILDGKSQRLKDLTDDLVEASKISSGNIVLNMEVLDLGELLKQTIGELSEKLEASKLQVVAEIDEKPAYVYADSRRMWRVMENLFNNICKYAMEGTRVYAEVIVEDKLVKVKIKNVSRAQMNIHADELTERFIRGDSSRSTEGSGLGLYIAKSLTNVQGGSFEIKLDADLFKVNMTFPLYEQKEN